MRLRRLLPLIAATGCAAFDSGRVDSTALEQTAGGPVLRVTILGDPNDQRVPEALEAISHWSTELRRLGRRLQLDTGTVRNDSVPDDVLRAASREAVFGGGPATMRLRAKLDGVPGGIIIALSHANLVSFSVRWQRGKKGVVGVRRADIPPLSLPNTIRNVIAHELGHVLGLSHNADSTTLMCGRPTDCRPRAFVSESAHFFPLTRQDERVIRERWP